MKAYRFPQSIRQSVFQVKDFLGVDFTTHESEVNLKRSPDAVNLISGQTGSMDKRFGTKIEQTFPFTIQAMTNISYQYMEYNDPDRPQDGGSSSVMDASIVVCFNNFGNAVIYLGTPNTTLQMLVENGTNYSLSNFTESGLFTNVDSRLRLLKMDDHNYLLLGASRLCLIHLRENNSNPSMHGDSFLGNGSFTGANQFGYVVDFQPCPNIQFLHFHIPITSIGRSPNGLVATPFEIGENILSSWVGNHFLANGSATVFVLSKFISMLSTVKVYLRLNGVWILQTTGFTASNSGGVGIITFASAPAVPTVSGEDNVKVVFAIVPTTIDINRFSNFAYFGHNGEANYAFVSVDGTNRDYRIRLKDWYLDENSFSDLGSSLSNIMGYSLYGNFLVTHTKKIGENPTIFLRTASLDDKGEVVFPIQVGMVGVGAISHDTFASLRGDIMWLSEYGVVSLVTNNISNTQAIQDRGFYINSKVNKESAPIMSIAFTYQNKYFLCVNGNMYVADSRKRHSETLSFSESFQYDWYYFENVNVWDYYIHNDILFMADGIHIKRFKTELDTFPYCDETSNTATQWVLNTHYFKGAIVFDMVNANYYICLKTHLPNTNISLSNQAYWQKIIQSTNYQVPVLSYWTTPIMNMGDITMRKTLKNLWVRLGKYQQMSARIYYMTQGISRVISEQYDGYFDFDNINFERFTFSTDTDPSVLVTNRTERKFMSIQFKVESRDEFPFSLLEIVGKYTFNNQFKG